MKIIFKEGFKVLKNNKALVLNVSDIIGQVNGKKYSKRRIPLFAYFLNLMEEIGFEYTDNYIWDKGEPQTKRHLMPPYPFYRYLVNSYEYITVYFKYVLNMEKIPCPVCNSLQIAGNSYEKENVKSWECRNKNCPAISKNGRGKRFSERTIMRDKYKKDENKIPKDILKLWRRDIVSFPPVIKINNKRKNLIKHSAPFPEKISEMSLYFFSGIGDIVLDMFMGSGTTVLVDEKLNRKWIGIELNSDYCEIIKQRIINFRSTTKDLF